MKLSWKNGSQAAQKKKISSGKGIKVNGLKIKKPLIFRGLKIKSEKSEKTIDAKFSIKHFHPQFSIEDSKHRFVLAYQ